MKQIGFLSLFFLSMAFGNSLDPQIKGFEASVEKKVQEIAKLRFGPEVPVVVTATATRSDKVAPVRNQAINPSDALDVGYLPLPVLPGSDKPNGSYENLEVGSLDISILIPQDLDAAGVKDFEDQVRKNYSLYRPKTSIQRLNQSDYKGRKPAEEEKKEEKAKEERPEDRWPLIVYSTIAFVAALLGFLGLRSLGQGLNSGLANLTQGIQVLKPGGGGGAGGIGGTTKLELSEERHEVNSVEKISENSTSYEDINTQNLKTNLARLLEIVEKSPFIAVSTLTDSREDLTGFRWVLTQIEKDARENLKFFLGEFRLKKMAEVQDQAGFSIATWLQEFNGRMIIRQLEDQSFLDKSLTSQEIAKIFQYEESTLVEACLELHNAAAWRLVTEIVSSSRIQEAGPQMETKTWTLLLQAPKATVEEAKSVLSQFFTIADRIQQSKAAGKLDPKFSEKVIDPLLRTLRKKPFGEDEKFLASLKQVNPLVVSHIEENFWTLNHLSLIEDNALKELMLSANNETLFALTVSTNKEWKERIKGWLPDGMKKTIVMDLVQKSETNASLTEKEAALTVAKDFVENLRQAYQRGDLPKATKPGAAA